MLNKLAVSYCIKWTRNLRMVNYSSHTKVCSELKHSEPLFALDLESRYNRQTIEKVLDVLNTENVMELTRYDITKGRLQQMEKYRRKNGPFTSIDQILEVENFGANILEKFVISIIEGPNENKNSANQISKLLRSLVMPVLNQTKKASIGTVTSIHISEKYISWAHMESNGRLLSWDCYDSFEWPKKDDTMHLHNMALQIRNRLPISDVYIMEKRDTQMYSPGISQLSTIFTNLRLQLNTMLIVLIATNFNQTNENGSHLMQMDNCYFLQRRVTLRLFDLVVGNENVSAYTLINQMINKNVPAQFQHILPVKIESSELEIYKDGNPLKKEALSQALLLSIAFVDLVLHCNPISLKSLTFCRKDNLY